MDEAFILNDLGCVFGKELFVNVLFGSSLNHFIVIGVNGCLAEAFVCDLLPHFLN